MGELGHLVRQRLTMGPMEYDPEAAQDVVSEALDAVREAVRENPEKFLPELGLEKFPRYDVTPDGAPVFRVVPSRG